MSERRGPLSIPVHGKKPASESHSQFLDHAQLLEWIKEIAQEGERRTYALEIYKCFLRSAEDALSGAIQIGFEFENDLSKNTSFRFREIKIAELALEEAMTTN